MVPGDPQWSLEAPKVLLDPPKMKSEKKQIHKIKGKNLNNLEISKDAPRKTIEICLVKILSTYMACHLVTNRMHHEYS
jgi:hypothetical protein